MKNERVFVTHLDTPIGIMLLSFISEFELVSSEFKENGQTLPQQNGLEISSIENAVKQFEEYFEGSRKTFNLKLSP